MDLVPVGDRVLAGLPALFAPFFDASEIEVTGPLEGRIVKSHSFGSPGEPVRLDPGPGRRFRPGPAGGSLAQPGTCELVQEMERRYGAEGAPGVVGAATM